MKPTALIAAMLFLAADVAYSQLIITEVMAKNQRSIKDEDGDRSDWFEIYNNGKKPIRLDEFAVTDSVEEPLKWQLPERELAAGEFAIIFASGKDRRSTEESHANFKLSASGEYLAVVKVADEQVIHAYAPMVPKVHADQSCGLSFENDELSTTTNGVAFDLATPGKPNETPAQPRVADVQFDVEHGFFTEPFHVALDCASPGANIRFTIDGTLPTEEHGRNYEQPLRITTTTTLRVAAFKDGHRQTEVRTATYVFPRHVVHQPGEPRGWPTHFHPKQWDHWRRRPPENNNGRGMKVDYAMSAPEAIDATDEQIVAALQAVPTLSVVTDQSHFFDEDSGIFQNSEQRGRESERPVSVELIDPTGREPGFQVNAGIRIRGGHSRRHHCQKHSLRLYFRSEYGPNKLDYPLFGDEGVSQFDDLDLRTAQNYSYHMGGGEENTMIREVFSRDSQSALGQPYARSRYYHLYLNGLYWGLYQSQEHIEASYASHYFGGDASEYDAIKSRAGHGGLPTDGTDVGWRTLWEKSNRIAASDSAEERQRLYRELQGLDPDGKRNHALSVFLDVDNLIDYMLVIFLTGNFDGPITNFGRNRVSNNWFSICERNGNQGFQFFCHDSEHTLGGMRQFAEINRVGPFPGGEELRQSNPQWIHQQLLAVETYRERFRQRAEQSLLGDGPLSLGRNLIRLRHRAQEVDRIMLAEIARWGDTNRRQSWKKSNWDAAVVRIEDVLRLRAQLVPKQLAAAKRYERGSSRNRMVDVPLFNALPSPEFEMLDARSGAFQLVEDVPVDAKIFYTTGGIDPRGNDGQPHPAAKAAQPYGFNTKTLVGKTSAVRAYVPEDDSLRTNWVGIDFDDSGWMEGQGGVGYDIQSDYGELIGVDLEQKMHKKHSTAYVRYSFDLDETPDCDRVLLKLNYEDGFVVYLNGKAITRRNAAPNSTWNSQATQGTGDEQAINSIRFDFSHHMHRLRKGKNVLAFHLLNQHADSSDLLLAAELQLETDVDETFIELTDEAPLLARVFSDDNWSPLFRYDKHVSRCEPASAKSLVLSEIMYRPAKPTDAEKQAGFENRNDFEFLEFANVGTKPVDLSGVFARKGIHFVVSNELIIPPQGHAVLAANPAAFALRYSTQPDGRFLGRLSNSGEVLSIREAKGQPLANVDYGIQAPWPTKDDAEGHSLVLKKSNSTGPDFSDPDHWEASADIGGTPGR